MEKENLKLQLTEAVVDVFRTCLPFSLSLVVRATIVAEIDGDKKYEVHWKHLIAYFRFYTQLFLVSDCYRSNTKLCIRKFGK